MPNVIEIEETFCGRTGVGPMYVRTDGYLRPALLGRLCQSRPKILLAGIVIDLYGSC